jgi:class 3 adenylate cyclase/predicted ATPase
MSDIRTWLNGLGLGEYAEVFEAEKVTVDTLPELTDGELRELGLPLGPRKALLKALREGAADPGPSSPPPEAAPQSAERRQITVMFCDLVGSTALSERLDPEDLRGLMGAYQKAVGEVIARYDGHVAQYLGDGVMAYFGWPHAHEDDAERAVRAGLDVVDAIKAVPAPTPLQVRVGIATGPVVVGESGARDDSSPKLAVGETPNLAARLQGLAGTDELVIADDTRRLTGGVFEGDDVGPHSLKGIVEPVRAFRVTGLLAAEGRFAAAHRARLTLFVGRETELALLWEKWQRAKDGEGQLVLLCGEPGIGKSRLTQELRQLTLADGGLAHLYQCSPFHTNTAFHLISEAVARQAGFVADDDATTKLDKLDNHLRRAGLRVEEASPLVAAALSIPTGDRYPSLAMSPQKQKVRTVETFAESMLANARDAPVLFLIEDIHWSDPSSLEAATRVVERLGGLRFLAVFTYRPEFSPPWTGRDYVTPLMLSRLRRATVEQMIANVTGGKPLPDELTTEIIAKTDGVPLFVEELTKTVLEGGVVEEGDDAWRLVHAFSGLAIPATLQDSLMARLDRLAPVKEVAQTAACIGREFTYPLLAAISPLSDEALQDALRQLTESGLIFPRGSPPEATYTFKHALVRDAAYGSLLNVKRQQAHAAIARVLVERFPEICDSQGELLAHHYQQAGRIESAIQAWLKAGEHAYSRSAHNEAIAHLTKGLSALLGQQENPERDRLELAFRVVLGNSLNTAKGLSAQETGSNHLRALSLARAHKQVPQIFQIHYGLAAHLIVKGELTAAREHCEAFLAEAEALADADAAVIAWRILGTCRFGLGDFKGARDALESALVRYGNGIRPDLGDLYGHDPRALGLAYLSQALWVLGYPDGAVTTIAGAVAHAKNVTNLYSRCLATGDASHVFMMLRDPGSAMNNAKIAVDVAADQGFPDMLSHAKVLLGWSLTCEGRPDEGIRLIREGIDSYRLRRASLHLTRSFYALADALARDGKVSEALDAIDNALGIAEETNETYCLAGLYQRKGALLVTWGEQEVASAAGLFDKAIAVARSQCAKSWELRAATSLAQLWHSQGMQREAHDLLAPVYDWFTEGFDTADLKEAKALLEELRSAPPHSDALAEP